MFFTQSEQYDTMLSGHLGRPPHYPCVEETSHLLFYIQRSQNINSVIYEANVMAGDVLNLHEPIRIKWIRYDDQGNYVYQELNYIQKKLAYGYNFNVISNNLIEFHFVSYETMKFYLCLNGTNKWKVATNINGTMVVVKHLFVYSEDMGIFPQVKFVEFFCQDQLTNAPIYHKLVIE